MCQDVGTDQPCDPGRDPRAGHPLRLPHDHPAGPVTTATRPQAYTHECHAEC